MTEQALPKIGDRIRLIEMPNDPCPIPAGTKGTVTFVNETVRQIGVKWDTARSLILVIGVDKFEVLTFDELIEEISALVDQHGMMSEDLDNAVHDAASNLASSINNEGTDGQVRFLMEQWGPVETRKFVTSELPTALGAAKVDE